MDDPKTTLNTASEALRIAAIALDRATTAKSPNPSCCPATPRERAQLWLASMQRRTRILEPQLNEGSWAILMDLYVNKSLRPVAISSACIASGHPSSTALRWIKRMIELELIAREDDGLDGRRANLVLTPKGEAAVLAHLDY